MGLTKPVLYIVLVTLHLLFQMAACLLNGTTRILPVSNSADIVPITRVTVADATSLHKQQLKHLATKANSTGVKPPLKFPPKTRSKGLASLASSRKTEHEYGNVPNQSLVVGLVFGVLSIVGIIIGILVIKFRIHKVSPVAAARPGSSKGEE
ncbi:uncharacterized protein LOC125378072 [Haliotis rufescens]|uniref:uncharacterized protein LOC125378072 n=1 Tax=Haliotis rufescens TaxID=6454 RepID=UPI00201EF65F|nr:uncharacterized protein LOC125378072 [Haliotis rufescens]